jgi:cation:H+ antiporter
MFEALALPANLAAFAAAAAVVWIAGTRLAVYADALAQRTGLGHALLGVMMLGGITSLPELAVATTAAAAGHPSLSVNDVIGSAAVNVLIIALADAAIGREAITSVVASPGVLLQGVLGCALLALVCAATFAPDVALAGASAWSWALLFCCAAALAVVAKATPEKAWHPVGRAYAAAARRGAASATVRGAIAPKILAAAAAIIAAGFVLAKAAGAIATQTGLGTSFVGLVLLAMATSLPEVSTVLAAVRLKRYEMALADVFGTNIFNVSILFVVDLVYAGEPVLRTAGAFSGFAALLALLLTAMYVVGMIERRDRTVARMGLDSLVVLATYAAGIALLYRMR